MDHPPHLRDTLGGIGNEEENQCHDGRIETVLIEGQRHGIALEEYRIRRSRSRSGKRKLSFGRINPLHLGRRASLDE
jgi:hypothetical protein